MPISSLSTQQTHAEPVSDARRSLRRVLRCAIVIVAGLLLFYSKLTFDLTPWAQAVISSMTTTFYSDKATWEKTTVLLFVEDDLKIAQGRFPIPYDTHQLVVSELARPEVRPAAVFIDFAFVQPDRVSAKQFADLQSAVCELRKNVPVYVVDVHAIDAKAPAEGSVFGSCATPVGAHVTPEEPGGGLMSYPLCGAAPSPAPSHLGERLKAWIESQLGLEQSDCPPTDSAAVALWKLGGQPSPRIAEAKRDDRMALAWPARSRPQRVCNQDHEILDTLFEVYTEGADVLKRRCPYTRTVTVGQFLTDSDAFAASFKGKVVMYGAKLALGGDIVNSPTYRDLPGVYYHAMAYDNLLTFEGKPVIDTPPRLKLSIALVLSAIVGWLALRPPRVAATPTPAESLEVYVRVAGILFLSAMLGVGLVLHGTQHDGVPEYLVLGLFAVYLCMRWVTDRVAATMSFACFVFALAMYVFASISIEIFFSMILFLEVAHLILHQLTHAAHRVDQLRDAPGPPSWRRRALFVILDPFMPD